MLDIFKPKGSTSGTIAKDRRSLGTRKRAAGRIRLSAGARAETKKQQRQTFENERHHVNDSQNGRSQHWHDGFGQA